MHAYGGCSLAAQPRCVCILGDEHERMLAEQCLGARGSIAAVDAKAAAEAKATADARAAAEFTLKAKAESERKAHSILCSIILFVRSYEEAAARVQREMETGCSSKGSNIYIGGEGGVWTE